ncbi:type II secretion system F family protein [Salsipaludibacter albus]|uniref:type II secretion system F family protein n=1 Tax=Salsipaludibacter albus TaxID=2849650 RepID=UPI001EE47844|nr:type II secretion system F family protein [Salsipaludibacter albus]
MTVATLRTQRGPLYFAAAFVLMLVGLLLVPTAQAQDALGVTIREPEVREDGQTRLVVDVDGVAPGELGEDAFSVNEEGEAVGGVTAGLAGVVAPDEARYVMLAMDVSESTAGAPLETAVVAANGFTETVTAEGVSVGLVMFGEEAALVREPTLDPAEIASGLDELTVQDATRLYDGVVVAARTLTNFDGRRDILVFTDGTDNGSEATLDGAADAASLAGASVSSVALQTDGLDVDPLEALAEDTGGRVVQAAGVDDLGAAFADVAQDVNNQYILTYPSTGRTGNFEVQVVVTAGESTAADSVQVLSTVAPPVSVAPNVVAVASPGIFSSTTVGIWAVAIAALAVALILWSLLVPVSDRQVVRNLEAAVGSTAASGRREDISPTTAAMSRRAIELIERVPKPEGYDEAMQQRIDRASWPLRSSEFTTLRVVAALVAFGLVWALLDSILFALLFAAIAWVIPNIVLGFRVRARQSKFMEQLPDTLQLLAGSLKAGYGVLQAIDTVVKESREPTKSEFQRVLSEARLGLPLEQSLEDMADRIGTDDFRWVAVSISIQRRVGGNLAQLLETVAATLRERAATRRQISALSAEGRLSAVILTALPFALGAYMFLVNREYLSPLVTTGFGQAMLVGAIILMVIGVFWMKNLIEIDV